MENWKRSMRHEGSKSDGPKLRAGLVFSIAVHCLASVLCLLVSASPSFADDDLSVSGRLDVTGVQALSSGSIREDPGFQGRIKADTNGATWRLHSWLEGGWDGTAKRPPRDPSLFKSYDEVYQSNSPYLEVKELFVAYSSGALDLRAGIQRFSWGRLDEFPPNDLLNSWDYTQFLRRSLEDRKIGVPSISGALSRGDWTFETVWVPVNVPYRLPFPDERWAGSSAASLLAQTMPDAVITPKEPDLPDHSIDNSNIGARIKHAGDIEWAMNLFHGYDPRPVFRTTALAIVSQGGDIIIDPGYVPDLHRITTIGFDAALVTGSWSFRAEAAYTANRYFNIRREFWGYPAVPAAGIYPLDPAEQKRDTVDYGIGADYRLFEDATLFVQAQQTVILGSVDLLYEHKAETLLSSILKMGWMNQKLETNLTIAYNPEHRDTMVKANAWYIFTDSWKAGISAIALNGPAESIFGRYSRNDQIEADLVYSW